MGAEVGLVGAVESLPDLTGPAPDRSEAPALAPTGTDGAGAVLGRAAPAQRAETGTCLFPSAVVASDSTSMLPSEDKKTLDLPGFDASRRSLSQAPRLGLEPRTYGVTGRDVPAANIKSVKGLRLAPYPSAAPAQRAAQSVPSELREVMDAWPSLPEAVRAGIVAMIRAAAKGQ